MLNPEERERVETCGEERVEPRGEEPERVETCGEERVEPCGEEIERVETLEKNLNEVNFADNLLYEREHGNSDVSFRRQ